MPNIAVTGTTGNLGRIAIEDLLTRVEPSDLVAVSRTPSKATEALDRIPRGSAVEVRHGDYDDPASLENALNGVDVLLLVSGPTPGVRVSQHRNVVIAATMREVERIVYTSAIGADKAEGFLADHTDTEKALRESGLAYTLLRNTFYTEGFVGPAVAQAKEFGEVTSSTEGHRLNTATIRDLALAASAAVTGSGHEDAVYELRGPLWTYPDLAAVLSRALDKPVTYREISDGEAGPAAFVFKMVRAGIFAEPSEDLPRLLGRPAMTLDEAIAAQLS